MVDQAVIEQIRTGNDEAFRQLVEAYKHDLFRAVYAILRNQKDAEDATQEAFVKIYHSFAQHENQGLKTWMTRVAVHHAIDVKRKLARRQEDSQEILERSRTDDMVQTLIYKEQQTLIHQKLAELPTGYREIIVDFYINEKTYQQIADEYDIQVKNVEMRLYRARQWMKKYWKEDEFS